MHLLQLLHEIPEAIMLKLSQKSMRNISRHVATTCTFADLCGHALRNSGGQLLSAQRFTHYLIIPVVGPLTAHGCGTAARWLVPADTRPMSASRSVRLGKKSLMQPAKQASRGAIHRITELDFALAEQIDQIAAGHGAKPVAE
jgi:hypothetical protein